MVVCSNWIDNVLAAMFISCDIDDRNSKWLHLQSLQKLVQSGPVSCGFHLWSEEWPLSTGFHLLFLTTLDSMNVKVLEGNLLKSEKELWMLELSERVCVCPSQSRADGKRPEQRSGIVRQRPRGLLEAEGSESRQEEGPAQEPGGPERHAGHHQVPRLRESGVTWRCKALPPNSPASSLSSLMPRFSPLSRFQETCGHFWTHFWRSEWKAGCRTSRRVCYCQWVSSQHASVNLLEADPHVSVFFQKRSPKMPAVRNPLELCA